jgi:2-hydroxy-3-oxopropionate reductase
MEKNMSKHIGFIGLGLMGLPMARNLMKAGYTLTVHNRSRGNVEQLVSEGAKAAENPSQVAQEADVIITMLPNSPDVEEIVLGPSGVIESAKPDSVVIDMSTISPSVSRKISEKLAEKDIHMLEAPVSGGQIGAEKGILSIMVGGKEEIFDRCGEIFDVLGKSAVYMGGPGQGQVAKLANNIICAITIESVCEGVVLAAKAGLDPNRLLQAIGGGAAACWSLDNKIPKIAARDFSPTFRSRLHNKDLLLALEAGRDYGVPLPVTEQVQKMYASLEESGEFDEDNCAIVKILERIAGIEVQGS